MKNQNHPKHKLALAAVQNNRNRHPENDLQNKDVKKDELAAKSVTAVAKEKQSLETESKRTLETKLSEISGRSYQQGETRSDNEKN